MGTIQFNWPHIVAFAFFMAFGRLLFGATLIHQLVGMLLLCSSMYTVALVDSRFTFLKPAEAAFLTLALLVPFVAKRPSGRTLIGLAVVALGFALPLVYNSLFFTPIEIWEINPENRNSKWDKFGYATSLSTKNITQTAYVFVGLMAFGIVQSQSISRQLRMRMINFAVILTTGIGILQIVLYYAGIYDLYAYLFYNSVAAENTVLKDQVLFGIKRMNGTLPESSVFGHCLTLLLAAHHQLTRRNADWLSNPVTWLGILTIAVSTSVTGYLGLIGLVVLCVFSANSTRELTVNLVVVVLLIIAYLGLLAAADPRWLAELIASKQGSAEERFYHGIERPWLALLSSPMFGYGFGTDRPTTLVFNLLIGNGLIGCLLIGAGLAICRIGWAAVRWLSLVFVLGLLVPDMHFLYIWTLFGLLAQREQSTTNSG